MRRAAARQLQKYQLLARRALYGRELHALGRRVLHPRVRSVGARARRVLAPELEYVPEGWQRALVDPAIAPGATNGVAQLTRLVGSWPEFVRAVRSDGPLGINPELPISVGDRPQTFDVGMHNTVLTFGYALSRASWPTGRLSVLDWGGGLGHYSVLARALLPGVALDYSCRDAPEVCSRGRQLVPEVTFYEDDSCFDRTYRLVMASGSLALNEDWKGILRELARVSRDYVYIARLPVVFEVDSFVTLHRAYALESEVAWLQWALSPREFLGAARELGLTLEREFLAAEAAVARRAPARIETRHFLFRKREGVEP